MSLLDRILEPPSYGWQHPSGELVIPSKKQILAEAFSRVNIFRSRKNWISFFGWTTLLAMMPFFVLFITRYFSLPLLGLMIVYAMIVMGTHGTVWYHRYCTHKAYKFSHPVWRFLTQHLVIRTLPEEIYVISHHVHHAKSDQPGDPYNSRAGLMYCLFADVNHQPIARNLSETD